MKKTPIFIVVLLLFSCLLLAGCVDFYVSQRPSMSPDEMWVSETPNIYFVGWDEEKNISYGQLLTDSGMVEIKVNFNHGTGIFVSRYDPTQEMSPDELLFKGDCTFSQDKLTVRVSAEEIFGEAHTTITFRRQGGEDKGTVFHEDKGTVLLSCKY